MRSRPERSRCGECEISAITDEQPGGTSDSEKFIG